MLARGYTESDIERIIKEVAKLICGAMKKSSCVCRLPIDEYRVIRAAFARLCAGRCR